MGLDFFLTSLIVILIPGTGVVYTVATGIAAGRGPEHRGRVWLHARHRAAYRGLGVRGRGLAACQRGPCSRR